MKRFAIGVLGGALLLTSAVAASAQNSGNTEGSVAFLDLPDRTVTFRDGRIMHIEPGARVFINGRQVTQLTEVRPNVWVPAVATPVDRTTTVVQGPPQEAAAVTPSGGLVLVREYPVVAVTETTTAPTVASIPATGYYARIDEADVLLVREREAP